MVGLDLHIGSQITELDPFEEAFIRISELVETLREDGHDITRLDLGGGLGIPYEGDDFPPASKRICRNGQARYKSFRVSYYH